MASGRLKEQAEALRVQARAARAEAQDAYFKRRSQLDLERERVATSKATAEHAAREASERAAAAGEAARASATTASELERASAEAAKKGDVRDAEETAESADHARRTQRLEAAREQQSTLDAAKFRQDAAAHDRRFRELEFEIRSANMSKNATEMNLDKLEEQSRLYDEAWRKLAAAEVAGDDVPRRAALELEAEAAITAADAITVDRAAIRVYAPGLPAEAPGVQSAAADVDHGDGVAETTPHAAIDTEIGAADQGSTVAAAPPQDDGSDVDVVGDLSSVDQGSSAAVVAQGITADAAPAAVDTSGVGDVAALERSSSTSEQEGATVFDSQWPTTDSFDAGTFEAPAAASEPTMSDDVATSLDTTEMSVDV